MPVLPNDLGTRSAFKDIGWKEEGQPRSRTTQPETTGINRNPNSYKKLRISKETEKAAKPGNGPSKIHHMPASRQLDLKAKSNSQNTPNLKSDLKQQEPS